MAMFTLHISLQLLLFSLLLMVSTITSSHHHEQNLSDTIRDGICKNVECGKGTCVPDLFGLMFHCECEPGWRTIKIGSLTFPSCLVPNCTLNFTCGSSMAPTPPIFPLPPLNFSSQPPIFSLPPLNFSSPCNLVWCGDGNCMVNGTEHYCQCNDGSTNLLGNPAFGCFRQCYFGVDCHHLSVVPQPPPPSPSSGSSQNGPKEASNCWKVFPKLMTAILTTMSFLTWM